MRQALNATHPTIEKFLTVAEVAAALAVSENTVIRQFSTVPGTIDLGTAETLRKRKKRMLRIPASVLGRFIADRQADQRRRR